MFLILYQLPVPVTDKLLFAIN